MRHRQPRISTTLLLVAALVGTVVIGRSDAVAASPSGDAGTLAGGNNFTCAITSANTVKCWGSNTHGQLGDGTTTPSFTAQTVPGLTDVVEISGGWQHMCALTGSGGVKCWGLNAAGQVGNGTIVSPQPTPVDVVGLSSGVQAISTGAFHGCALLDSGGVQCWGDNPSGALGNGTTVDSPTPVDVTGLASGVAAIGAGDAISCAVLDTSALKCWGDNPSGALGNGTTTNRLTPTDVVGLGSGVASVSAESTYPLGSRTCAVTTTGAAKCWGVNNQGQLGDGTTTHRTTPVDVVGLGSGVAALTTGSSQTCARLTSGAAKCWGQWAVGNGSGEIELTPVDVVGLSAGVVELQAGGFHTCAQKSTGAVVCWGGNGSGQLGLGTDEPGVGSIPRDVSGSFHRPECPTVIPAPRSQFVSTDGYAVGSALTFFADPGFELSAPTTLTCQSDLTFDGVPPTVSLTSTITIDPAAALAGGTEISVALSGFAPDTEVGWCQAVTDQPLGPGNCSAVFLGQTDGAGELSTTMRVDRFIYAPGPDRWADCATEACVIGAAAIDDLSTGTIVALDVIAPAPPASRGSITLDPLRQNGGGNGVTVIGEGFRPGALVDIHQCTSAPTTPASCTRPLGHIVADESGNFTTGFWDIITVPFVVPPGASHVGCFDPSGACVIAAAEAADFPATVATADLDDVGPIATVIPGAGIAVEGDGGSSFLEIEVSLSNDWHETIEVPWSTIFEPAWDPGLRADPGLDYSVTSGTVVFEPFDTTATVRVPVIGDQTAEGSELVVVSFQKPTNARIGGFWGLGFGAIVDDDAP